MTHKPAVHISCMVVHISCKFHTPELIKQQHLSRAEKEHQIQAFQLTDRESSDESSLKKVFSHLYIRSRRSMCHFDHNFGFSSCRLPSASWPVREKVQTFDCSLYYPAWRQDQFRSQLRQSKRKARDSFVLKAGICTADAVPSMSFPPNQNSRRLY